MTEIQVELNGERTKVPGGLNVQSLLEHLTLQPKLVVVEKNGEILRRGEYPGAEVSEGDVLELVHFVGGG